MRCLISLSSIVDEIEAEAVRAASIYPDHHSLAETLGVLALETGEVVAAVQARDLDNAEEELIQVAAVAIRGVFASRARRTEQAEAQGLLEVEP